MQHKHKARGRQKYQMFPYTPYGSTLSTKTWNIRLQRSLVEKAHKIADFLLTSARKQNIYWTTLKLKASHDLHSNTGTRR